MIYFILGIAFGVSILPILDSLTGLILTSIEAIKTKIGIDITKSHLTIRKMESEQQEDHTFAIGFQVPPDPEE